MIGAVYSPREARFPTAHGASSSGTYIFPLANALAAGDLLGVELPARGQVVPLDVSKDLAAELRDNPPHSPGWSFADTTSGSPLLPRIGFPHSDIPIGRCGEATLTSTPDGILLTGHPLPLAAIFRDPDEGLLVLDVDGGERPAATPDAADLLHALLEGRDHLTVVPAGSGLTLRPLLARLAVCVYPVQVSLRDDAALRL